jgi:hypothetical protein
MNSISISRTRSMEKRTRDKLVAARKISGHSCCLFLMISISRPDSAAADAFARHRRKFTLNVWYTRTTKTDNALFDQGSTIF